MNKPILLDPAENFNACAAAKGWPIFCDRGLSFERPELSALSATWRRLAGMRAMPARVDMTPHVLKDCLAHVALYECVRGTNRPQRFRVRLMGSSYQPITGELTGKFLDEVMPQALSQMWTFALGAVLACGRPLRLVTRSEVTGKTFLIGEGCSAPLTDTNGEATLVLSAAYYGPGRWEDIAREIRDKPRVA